MYNVCMLPILTQARPHDVMFLTSKHVKSAFELCHVQVKGTVL